MKILAIETSTHACSVAINSEGDISEKYQFAPREHHQILLPMIDSLLAEASLSVSELDAIAFGCGPGSFTGIRIAASVTQGIAMSHDIPVMPISTLLIMAQTGYAQFGVTHVIPCLDARMEEIYWCCCQLGDDQLMQIVDGEYCTKPHEIKIPTRERWIGLGDGWEKYEFLKKVEQESKQIENVYSNIYPRADELAKLASPLFYNKAFLPPEKALPRYLRDMIFKKREV